jgi:autotransporter translocation and assembly factor TamB
LAGKILRRTLIVVGCIVVLFVAAATVLTLTERGRLRGYLSTALSERFHSDVEIHDISVYVYPRVYLVAHGISLRLHGRTDVPPLLTMQTLTVSADLPELLAKTKHVARVNIEGLNITVPPRPLVKNEEPKPPKKPITLPLVIDEITAEDAKLVTLPRDANKEPHEWDIHHLVMEAFSFEQAAHFHATLTNPKPIGEIDSSGEFGPWDAEDPGETPVEGTFSFSNADLSSLKGLGGILSSKGKYDGVLDNLNVEGDTDTPDFSLDVSGNPVHLTTHYVAVVDGTNGDTHLKPVIAHFLHTTVEANGDIIGIRGIAGKDIELDSVVRDGRVEDLLRLVMKSDTPTMTGRVSLTAKISLPPHPGEKVFDRLGLDGRFGVSGGHFTSDVVQGRVDTLSRKGQGEPKNEEIEDVISNLRGNFILKDRQATFSDLAFDVRGASVQLSGTYDMANETLDFHGHLLMKAKISQMTTGVKSFFLKAVDPFFSKNGGTDLPIKITGTRAHPTFGLDRGHGEEKKREQNGKG